MTNEEIRTLLKKLLECAYSKCKNNSIGNYNQLEIMIEDVINGNITLQSWLEALEKICV